MGAIESTMAKRDTNGYPMDILLADTERERKPKSDKAGRDSMQTFYSANEGSESDNNGYHSPALNHEAAWSPLEKEKVSGSLPGPFSPFLEPCFPIEPQASSSLGTPFSVPGRLKGPFSPFLEPYSPSEPQVSSRLEKPFSGPERRRSRVKPRVSNRLDSPFSGPEKTQRSPVQPQMVSFLDGPFFGPEQVPFAPTNPSSSYDDENATRSRNVKKYRPESTTSLNSQLTREIKNFHGHDEPAAASEWQTPINPRD